MIVPSCKSHLVIKQFSLHYDEPSMFIVSQWQKDKKIANIYYLIYRILIALFFFVTWTLSLLDVGKINPNPKIDEAYSAKWLIYLTNWGYTLCTFQAVFLAGILSACILSKRLHSKPNLAENALKLYKIYWVTNTISIPLAFGITTMYWAFIYNPNKHEFNAMNYFVHGNNSLLMMIDLWVVCNPVRILHFLFPLIFGLLYVIFSVVYYLAGGTSREGSTYIYTILNWDKPGTSIGVCLGVMAFLIILHIFHWCLHKLRTNLYDCLFRTPSEEQTSIQEKNNENFNSYENHTTTDVV